MPNTREVVGWMDQSEWEAVFNNLFSGKRDRIQHGLDVINIWKCRFAGRMPVGIEATSQVLGCRMLDAKSGDLCMRQSMATALSQFLGLLTERALKGQIRAIPMKVRGEEFGIPEWVTSLRHDIAHGLIPSKCLLEKGVEFALQWLKVHHWDEHLKNSRSKTRPPVTQERSIQRDSSRDSLESWNLCTDDLTGCPFGILPGQKRDMLWRELHGSVTFEENSLEPDVCHDGSSHRAMYQELDLLHCNFDLL